MCTRSWRTMHGERCCEMGLLAACAAGQMLPQLWLLLRLSAVLHSDIGMDTR